jgi:tRNA(fMet)-specific endonuclease VapC
MSGKKYLLDTNIVIGLFANEQSIIDKIKSAEIIFIPSIVIGELFYGSAQSTKKEENGKKIEEFAKASLVIPCTVETAYAYGKIKSQLKSSGTPIPENDIWIAALAMQYKVSLVSRDKHFGFVDGISLEKW